VGILGVYIMYHLSVNLIGTIQGLIQVCKEKCYKKKQPKQPVFKEATDEEKSPDQPEAPSALEVIEEMSNESSSVRSQVEEILQKKRLGCVTKEELARQG